MYVIQKNSTPSVTPLQTGDTILAFGDSLTHGYGAGAGESYPERLSASIGVPVINAGINGETSADGLRRLPTLLQKHAVRLMILCFGGNDILQKRSMSQLKANLIEMITLAKAQGIEVVMLSVPNIDLFGMSPLELYTEISKETDTPLIEGILADILEQPSLKSDQIHPNARGYQQMAREVEKGLRKIGYVAN